MDFMDSVRTCLHKYAVFEGRASRSEFWWFYLFVTLVSFAVVVPGTMLVLVGAIASGSGDPSPLIWVGLALTLLGSIATLGLLLPMIAVGCRRLQDRGQSGWLLLLSFVPFGSVVLLVFWVLEGTPGDNAYGPPPA